MLIEGTRTIAQGERELVKLLTEIESSPLDWNETETRFQIIDRIIVECLGWPRDQVRLEAHEGGEYTDYELGQPRGAIWEAKRIGRVFELPADPRRRITTELQSLMAIAPDAADAIKQVQGYCSRRGVDVAVVANGYQLIAFLATRSDGVAPLEGQCLVINGLAQLKLEFARVWQMLSPAGVAQNKLKRFLRLGEGKLEVSSKVSASIKGYRALRPRNAMQRDLQVIAELLLIDLPQWPESESEFYARCYCKERTLSRFSLISKEIIEARVENLFPSDRDMPIITPLRKASWRGVLASDIQAEMLSRRPVILLGDVGVGKTSFFKNLMFVDAAKELEQTVCIYVDLAATGALEQDMRQFVLREIATQLLSKYKIDIEDSKFVRSLYATELKRFESSIFGDLRDENPKLFSEKQIEFLNEKLRIKYEHVGLSIAYVTETTKRPIVIVIDNSDQRTKDIQIETFAIANELAKNWGALVFTSMRPQTYLTIRREVSANTAAERVFVIEPPRIEDVLRLRLNFAVEVAEGRLSIARLQKVTLDLISFAAIAKGLSDALRGSIEFKKFFANFFNNDVSHAIESVSKFFGNPNVNERRIIRVSNARGGSGHSTNIHDIWTATLYGQCNYYNPDRSPVINLFDIHTGNPADHFLLPMILGYLDSDGAHRGRADFVSESAILLEMQDWGFSTNSTAWSLDRASQGIRPLLERLGPTELGEGDESRFRLTKTGSYYLSEWITDRFYFEAMWCDVPGFDDSITKTLVSRAADSGPDSRILRANVLRGYLTGVWEKSTLRPPYFRWKPGFDSPEVEMRPAEVV